MEKIPLLSPKRNQYSNGGLGDDGYLLLSMPNRNGFRTNESKSFIQKLICIGNCSGITVAVSGIVMIVLVILGITYHADISELMQGVTTVNNNLLKATPARNILKQSSSVTKELVLPLGRLNGYTRISRQGREFLAFYKVPYAKSPIGPLRFKDPQPVEKWDGVRDYPEVAPQCIQKAKYSPIVEAVVGDENCLYLNIYTPKVPENGEVLAYPTMLYIHGGGFNDGNGSRYGAEYFMDEDIVLITFQFRLGILGFLNTGDREATGNMALKDQVMALKFIQNYISYFGGNPNSVTIFGNSGGGMCVGFLMISPMSKDLFHRAISESGTSLTETSDILDLQPEITKQAVAEKLNCSHETSVELLNCLRNIDAKDIALLRAPEIRYSLTVEKGFDPNNLSDVFMPDKPYKLLQSGNVHRIPYIIGINSAEYITAAIAILKSADATEEINANFSSIIPSLIRMNVTNEESQLIKTFYFGDNDISNDTERNLTNLVSDRIMVHASKVSADFHGALSDTYLYYLSKRPRKSYSDKYLVGFPPKPDAASHADELQFLFPYSGYPEYPTTDTEYFPFSEYMVRLWAHFAKTGNPAMSGEDHVWMSMNANPNTTFWYELNDAPGPTNVLQERMNFWDQFSHKKLEYDL
ncbi:Fatty acyl-CoA hydrolase precursor, medium chain [Orchesella cincta]|uniref:Carboxylic ester hydrolase n=1 Tax=Orchesella cincta TaxID=48709 RepID=A0A1D2N704_ORCCI|nr:Fatty acyl-CoA hydrolase precursor, medium chain [Orchesella cincta]